MPAEARVTSIWKLQRLFVAVFFIGFSGFFFWDGMIGYPRSNERWTVYEKYRVANRVSEWPADAASRGWTDKVPEKFHEPKDIGEQFTYGVVMGFLGLLVLGYWMAQKNRILKTEEGAVFGPSGKRIPFESIVALGKKDWQKKGIAIVRYELNGRPGQFKLDDYKFEHEPTHQIMAEIEGYIVAQNSEAERDVSS